MQVLTFTFLNISRQQLVDVRPFYINNITQIFMNASVNYTTFPGFKKCEQSFQNSQSFREIILEGCGIALQMLKTKTTVEALPLINRFVEITEEVNYRR